MILPFTSFNFDNPMVIIMKKRLADVDRLVLDNMKRCIFHFLLTIVIGLFYIINHLSIDLCIMYFTFMSIINYYNISKFIAIKKLSRFDDGISIIRGDYKNKIYVNNEEIMDIIQKANQAIGAYMAMKSVYHAEFLLAIASMIGILL